MIGQSFPKPDAYDKVTGAAIYAGDIIDEAMLHAKVVFTDRPHARILTLDTSRAEAVDGVVAVLTAADVPINAYGPVTADQPVFVGPGPSAPNQVRADTSRWEADHLALVVAETAEIAAAAAGLIDAEWEDLPVVADIATALAPDAPILHEEMGLTSNVYEHHRTHLGDPDAAFAAAHVIVEGTYELPYQEHAYLQTESAVAYIDEDDRVTIECGGQWVHEDQKQVAFALGLELDDVRVIYRAIGGAFGGKEDISLQIVLALAVCVLDSRGIRRPIRSEWSREESIVGHHKRHRVSVRTRWAADADGSIVAVESDAYLDAGSYNSASSVLLGCLHLALVGPYEIPAARLDSRAVFTTTVPGGAFRGFGAPQGAFVVESQINKLALALDMDTVELRRRNIFHEGSIGITGTELPNGVTMPQVLDRCEAEFRTGSDLPSNPPRTFASLGPVGESLRRGRGFAVGYKNIGFPFGFPETSEARIELRGDDEPTSADLYLAGADLGQGAHTIFLQIASDVTGIGVADIKASFSDTGTSGDSGSASASRLTFMAGNAILGACEEADKAWRDGDRPAVGQFKYRPPPTEPLDPAGKPTFPNFSYGYVAQAVDLSVDIATGHITVHDVVCVVDAGRVLNPTLLVGQVEGGVAQAHGYAISENLTTDAGRILNPRFSAYLIPGIADVPEQVRSFILETPDQHGPLGARGVAEMPTIPYAAAISAALHDATGVWFDKLPLTPVQVRAGLRAASEALP